MMIPTSISTKNNATVILTVMSSHGKLDANHVRQILISTTILSADDVMIENIDENDDSYTDDDMNNNNNNIVSSPVTTTVSSLWISSMNTVIVFLPDRVGDIMSSSSLPSMITQPSHHHNVTTTIVPVTDCVQWLQDLQRCLRRDDDVTRPISRLLHSWNIVVQKLLPLVVHTQYDSTLIITISKILVLLTKPLHVQTIRAGRMMIPASSSHTEHAE